MYCAFSEAGKRGAGQRPGLSIETVDSPSSLQWQAVADRQGGGQAGVGLAVAVHLP